MSNYFWYHLQINFDGTWSSEGQINTPVVPSSCPGYALCSSVLQVGTPRETVRKAFAARQYRQKMPVGNVSRLLSVPTGLLVVFARFLHAF